MPLINKILFPASVIYGSLSELNKKLTRSLLLPKTVISVGNITWGGSGKTPVVIKLAEDLIKRGLKPAVLTRGYKRKDRTAKCLLLSDGANIDATPEESGDEPYMLAESVPGMAVIVGADRFRCAGISMGRVNPDIFILDDGFQHWKLQRILDIVCVNALNPFGNGMLIPAGILREPISSLERAGLIIITNADLLAENELFGIEKKISQYCKKPLIRAGYRPKGLRNLANGRMYNIDKVKDREMISVSAIAGNIRFIKTLSQNGFNVVKEFSFRDHHWYSFQEIKSILSAFSSAVAVITTAKDAVRLKWILKKLSTEDAERFFVLDMQLDFIKGESDWVKILKNVLPFS